MCSELQLVRKNFLRAVGAFSLREKDEDALGSFRALFVTFGEDKCDVVVLLLRVEVEDFVDDGGEGRTRGERAMEAE